MKYRLSWERTEEMFVSTMCFSNISVGIQPQSLHWTMDLIVWPRAQTAKFALHPTERDKPPANSPVSTHGRDSKIMIPGWASWKE